VGEFDFGVIERSLGYLFREGMTFTLTLTGIAAAALPPHPSRALPC
jgi:glutamate/aspartate transport system permease protein